MGDRYSGAEVEELETTKTGTTLRLRPINPRNGGALGPAVSVDSTKLVVHGFRGGLEVGDQGVVACLRVGDVPFFFTTPVDDLRALPRGAFSQPVRVSRFRVVNFVGSSVSTMIAVLVRGQSRDETVLLVSGSHLASQLPRSFVFMANFSRSYPPLAASLGQLVELEPDCVLERKEDNLEHVSLACDVFRETELDFMGRLKETKQVRKSREPLRGSVAILVLSAILAITGLMICNRARRVEGENIRVYIGSRVADSLERRGVKSARLLDVATSLDPPAVMEAAQVLRGTHRLMVEPVITDNHKLKRERLRGESKGVLVTSAGMAGLIYGAWKAVSGKVSDFLRGVKDLLETSHVTSKLSKLLDVRPMPLQPNQVKVLFLLE
ncbi:hypothetical protein CSUI_005531 [Cystoisospora suis]|uniref:Uncharacterized protein n=1 Tax=Cystoisospora suis TaxID=483139 RepID=A0A2C6KXM1_9APIC|nr:hypothetical protein CSUI_005531 [Cystoisospora suis]